MGIVKRFLPLLLLLWITRAVGASPVRISLMDFAAEELSYRSAQSAADFTATLQSSLAAVEGVEWVERERIVLAAKELELAGLGFVEPTEAARAGRWVGADFALFGVFRTNSPGTGRILALDLVNLSRAASVARTNLAISSSPSVPLSWKMDDVEVVGRFLRMWISGALPSGTATPKAPLVALVAIAPHEDVRLDTVVEGLLSNASAANGGRYHRLSAVRESVSESEAFVAGLVAESANRPSSLADILVFASPVSSGKIEFAAWGPSGDASRIAVDPASYEVALAALRTALEKVSPTAAPMKLEDRLRMARDILSHAAGSGLMRGNFYSTSPNDRRRWMAACAMADVALFLAPDSREVRELWTRLRWTPSAAEYHARPFNFRRRALSAWLDLIARYGPGLSRTPDTLIEDRISQDPVRAVSQLMGSLSDDLWDSSDKAANGIPPDIGGRIIRDWHRKLMKDFLGAITRITSGESWKTNSAALAEVLWGHLDDNPPAKAEALARVDALRLVWPEAIRSSNFIADNATHKLSALYGAAGLNGRETELLSRLSKRPPQNVLSQVSSTNSPRFLPPLALLDEGLPETWFSIGLRPSFQAREYSRDWAVRFPSGVRVRQVTGAVLHEGSLWVCGRARVTEKETAPGRSPDSTLSGGTTREVNGIWRIAADASEAEPVLLPVAGAEAQNLEVRDGLICAYVSGRWWSRDGTNWAVAKFKPPGNQPPELRLFSGIVQRRSADGGYTNLVPAALWPEVNVVRPFLTPPFPEVAYSHQVVYETVLRLARVLEARPSSPVVPGPWHEGQITAFSRDGSAILVGTDDGIVAAFDTASQSYTRSARFDSGIGWLFQDRGRIWVVRRSVDLDRGSGFGVFRADVTNMPPASESWSVATTTAQLLGSTEAASLEIFSGRAAEASRIVEAVPDDARTSFDWLLLAAAYEDLGPDRIEEFKRARGELQKRFSGSIAEKVLALAPRRVLPPSPTEMDPDPAVTADLIMARLDRDQDGFVDFFEMEIATKVETGVPLLFRPSVSVGAAALPWTENETIYRLWQPVLRGHVMSLGRNSAARFSRKDLIQHFSSRLRPASETMHPRISRPTNLFRSRGKAP